MNTNTIKTPQLQGDRFRTLRRQMGLSAEKLARLSDVCTRTIWRLEANARPHSSAILVARVAQALETDLEYLIGLTDGVRPATARADNATHSDPGPQQ